MNCNKAQHFTFLKLLQLTLHWRVTHQNARSFDSVDGAPLLQLFDLADEGEGVVVHEAVDGVRLVAPPVSRHHPRQSHQGLPATAIGATLHTCDPLQTNQQLVIMWTLETIYA